MFFYLCKVLFSGFLQFNGNFVDGQNSSKYRHCVRLQNKIAQLEAKSLYQYMLMYKKGKTFLISARILTRNKFTTEKYKNIDKIFALYPSLNLEHLFSCHKIQF